MTWLLAGISTYGAALVIAAIANIRVGKREPTPARRAAMLAISAGIAWGFVAAIIKELSTHINAGPYAVFSNWSPYALLLTGAVAMFILSNAFQAGPLAASQPGLTIVDPLVASLLGVTVFGEHIRHSPFDLVGEGICLVILVASVILLSRSTLIKAEPPELETAAHRPDPGHHNGSVNGGPPTRLTRRRRTKVEVACAHAATDHVVIDPPAR